MEPTSEIAALDDVPGLVDIFFASFNLGGSQELFPNNEGGRKFITQMYERAILSPPGTQQSRVYLVREQAAGRVVACAIYFFVDAGEGGIKPWRERLPPVQEGMDDGKVDDFFTRNEKQHRQTIDTEPHVFLEVLATHEDYRGKGYASVLIKTGLELADELDQPNYLDASRLARPLYERHGYSVNPDVKQTEPPWAWAMLRKKKSEGEKVSA